MKIPSDRTARILLVAAVLVLLIALFSGGLPLLKFALIALVVVLAWNMADQPAGHSAFFSNDTWQFSGDEEHPGSRSCHYAFSNALLDLTDSSYLPERLDIHASFSSVVIRLPVDANITVHASCAFGEIVIPQQQGVVFGSQTAHCGSRDVNAPRLRIDVNCAFGAVKLRMG